MSLHLYVKVSASADESNEIGADMESLRQSANGAIMSIQQRGKTKMLEMITYR